MHVDRRTPGCGFLEAQRGDGSEGVSLGVVRQGIGVECDVISPGVTGFHSLERVPPPPAALAGFFSLFFSPAFTRRISHGICRSPRFNGPIPTAFPPWLQVMLGDKPLGVLRVHLPGLVHRWHEITPWKCPVWVWGGSPSGSGGGG